MFNIEYYEKTQIIAFLLSSTAGSKLLTWFVPLLI